MIKFIHNIGDYFSSNYFDEDFFKKVVDKTGYAHEDIKLFQKAISSLKDKYFQYKQTILEGRLRTKDKVTETHNFHSIVLNALGYNGNSPEYQELFHIDEKTVLPVRNTLYRGDQPHLMIMEMQPLIKEGEEEPDGLFEQRYNEEEEENQTPPQKYHRSQWENVFKVPEGVRISPMVINKAVSQLFLMEAHRRPKFIILCAGNVYYLLEQEKWFRGSYLEIDLESLFDEATIKRDYYSLFYFLFAKETLAPQSEIVLMEQLEEESHKSAYEVTKDLKDGVIHAVEAIANEAVLYLKQQGDNLQSVDAETLKNECLTYVYRLLFLFYAESREELDILPSEDAVYQHGYSLEMLRDLEQVPLNTASSQNGFFFHDSLSRLFNLLSSGYRERDHENRSFRIRHLDSPLFYNETLKILPNVKLRNVVWQDIICRLSLSKKVKGKSRGRISYANLGINQLGSVYESLLAFRGFFAQEDNILVHRKRKKNESSEQVDRNDGSFLVARSRVDDFDYEEVYRDRNDNIKIIPRGTFIYRLSGRDRQKSASYYTPEVLTQTTVKYTLKPILEKLDKGEMKALELLELNILEPAMGAAAFHNEVINQLAEAYLQYRQIELNKKVPPDLYREETQKIKTYIALNNVYGVDLNPTAIELGKLSLWLNVIHKDMQTPFFGYRLGVGNAVVGAWLKVFNKKDVIFELPSKGTQKQRNTPLKKEWWNKAPEHLGFSDVKRKLGRKDDQIYHFLLPDINMVPSSGIKLLREEYPAEAKKVGEWRKSFCQPVRGEEFERLQVLSASIDRLLEEHYLHQSKIHAYTGIAKNFWGAHNENENFELSHHSYNEKERLESERYSANAPYYKIKMIMDYWCSLWFWDMRDAADLPSREEWYNDIANILNIDLEAELMARKAFTPKSGEQTKIFETERQGELFYRRDEEKKSATDTISQYTHKKSTRLFTNNRLEYVKKHAETYRFFHYQLEFIEVFKERGGFDVAVGNPPWVKLQFEEKGLMSEVFPQIVIRKTTAPQVRKMQAEFLAKETQREAYFAEFIETEASSVFMNAYQNYPLLVGQQTNLYKCVLENGFHWISEKGYLGLIHPEGVYDDPKGQPLRKEIYQRLKYHFQFTNELSLFSEVHHNTVYGTQVYSGKKKNSNFLSISNLFYTSTIDSCFIHNGTGYCEGVKRKDENTKAFVWNLKPHKSRLVHFQEKELRILAKTFEGSSKWEDAKLVGIHAKEIMAVLEKIGQFSSRIKNFENKISEGWHETNDINEENIERNTKFPDIENYEMIYSGPHFFVANSLYKTPRQTCTLNSHYDIIDLNQAESDFVPRTNYIPQNVTAGYADTFKGFQIGLDNNDKPLFDSWFNYYKIGFRKMLSQAGERTLTGAILPPKTAHVNGVISSTFQDERKMIEAMSLTSSIVLDFFIKTVGRSNLYDITIQSFPLGVDNKFLPQLFVRTLQLNCLNKYYAPLWERNWEDVFKQDSWSKNDSRLKPFNTLTKEWQWETPLRNWFERRQALVEIDVITAMALGLTPEELILIYNVQFPVLQQNEDDTWYDTNGNIVFTVSKGLSGVGVDRPVWNTIKDLKAGETYEHTIEKSELYYGKKVTYHAPFDKCDRVEDYKKAWGHFVEVFK